MFTLREKKKVKAEVLVTGLPGLGRVGHVAANYIVEKMKLEPVAYLYSYHFPHAVIIDEKGTVRLFNNVFYYVEDAEKPFILVTGDTQPPYLPNTSPQSSHEYTMFILRYAQSLGVKEYYTMAGVDVGPVRFTQGTGVVCAGTDESILKKLSEYGCEIEKGGTISGIAGLLLGYAKEDGQVGASVMGKTTSHMNTHGDPGAAAAVLEVMMKVLGFSVDTKELWEANKEIEKVAKTLLTPPTEVKEKKQTRETLDYIT